MDGVAGVTAIDWSVAAVTVSGVLPEMRPSVAVTLNGPPTLVAVARPSLPAALLMVALAPELHVTLSVRSTVELSVYVPMALY